MSIAKGRRARNVSWGLVLVVACVAASPLLSAPEDENIPPRRPLRVNPAPIASDKSIVYDYDIVYVRAPRTAEGKKGEKTVARVWPNAEDPTDIRSSTDLMVLHPNGRDEVLVAGGAGAIADPHVSFDAQWVYFTRFHDLTGGSGRGGADVYKVHVPTRKVVCLTAPLAALPRGTLTVSIRDRQGNTTRIDRTFSVGKR